MLSGQKTPNQALQQTGHANDVSAWRHAAPRVSRLLSWLFGTRLPDSALSNEPVTCGCQRKERRS